MAISREATSSSEAMAERRIQMSAWRPKYSELGICVDPVHAPAPSAGRPPGFLTKDTRVNEFRRLASQGPGRLIIGTYANSMKAAMSNDDYLIDLQATQRQLEGDFAHLRSLHQSLVRTSVRLTRSQLAILDSEALLRTVETSRSGRPPRPVPAA